MVPGAVNLEEVLKGSSEHSTFFKLLQESQLSKELVSPYTIFAPTNQAFMKLSDESQHKIFGDSKMAENVLRNHIVQDVVCCSAVPSYLLFSRGERTIGGHSIHLRRTSGGRVLVNKGTIERCDIVAENGIMHSIDAVILPKILQSNEQEKTRMFWSF
ncbi:transforming growth factor-beta-induced protein ig-h3 [Eurytemora carolleeae]|uniref:transforming growth factor-beta-induced protein ig-h3 n=1 Tax=Eurytemora carolleeae TaxID=1294199 RepID=UPI000C774D39|nr:transforming growth factor-beta-induced protein ig-h3 [Eurytemora carolleeae]|eukprot:XP_023331403.1 transforming growth factor-beta-induced protein ig-h3-like [Eurytemora affinis]